MDAIVMESVVRIEHGLNVTVRDFVLKKLQEDQKIQEGFTLNIKRLNRWWYSVHFVGGNKANGTK